MGVDGGPLDVCRINVDTVPRVDVAGYISRGVRCSQLIYLDPERVIMLRLSHRQGYVVRHGGCTPFDRGKELKHRPLWLDQTEFTVAREPHHLRKDPHLSRFLHEK